METDKQKCDCLNDCGDDRQRIDSGEVEPCVYFKHCVAEREARAATARASAAAVRTLEAKGYTYMDSAQQWRPPLGKPPAWVVYDTDAARDVLAERARQVNGEGWTPAHDDQNDAGELARAASQYALNAALPFRAGLTPAFWPWAPEWWKPTTPRRDLIKAAALIIAEIERIDRAGGEA
ncbi:hypothetical protein [Paraburkholderia tropica]|uniref:hypothetical protein n=1 Tax=Paraburkholderia tropica TaxID=92647 RepID=UPI00161BDBB4|nr:hypothetical protein [Paraburkholderia tropica]MBB2981799.1 hypothetical protein [Paraburkholderia tropica]